MQFLSDHDMLLQSLRPGVGWFCFLHSTFSSFLAINDRQDQVTVESTSGVYEMLSFVD